MGWISHKAKFFKEDGTVNVKKEAKEYLKGCGVEIIGFALIGDIFYAAVKDNDHGNNVYCLIIETETEARSYGYEVFFHIETEVHGNYHLTCPDHILRKLSPTGDQLTNIWRDRCHEENQRREARKAKREARAARRKARESIITLD